MMVDPDKISRWVERKATAYLAWDERRTQAQFDKGLKVKRAYWILLALCGAMLVLGLMDHVNVAAIRSACALAAIVVFLKFVQFTLIALHRGGGSDE
jgi:hypothetical protein